MMRLVDDDNYIWAMTKRTQTAQERQLETARDELAGRPIAIDLFSGVGGLALGLEQAGFHVSHAVEIEEVTGRYAQYNFPHSRVLYGPDLGDVRRFGTEAFRQSFSHGDEPTLVAGGPPCQGFSVAGKKRADDPLNELVLEFARVVLELRPKAFLMENVPGITSSDSPSLARAILMLEKQYRVAEPKILAGWDFGVPQMRRRVFIVGVRKDLKIDPSLPVASHYRPNEQENLLLEPTPTCWEAISDLPEADQYPELISGDSVPYTKRPENAFQRSMRESGERSNEHDLSPRVSWNAELCTNLRRTQHGSDLLKRLAKLEFGRADKISGIRRLDPNDISTTIRAGTTESRGSWSAPRPLHPFSNRVLTTRECARIQTFPDWMRFHPVKWHGNRMVGNAVPPRLAFAVGRHLLQLLSVKPAPSTGFTFERDNDLIRADIEAAVASRYESRNVSQKVVSWSPKERGGKSSAR